MFIPWLLRFLALLLLGGGGWALVTGSDYIVLEAGAAMVIAGTVALAGGAVALGLAEAVARLEVIRRLLSAPMEPHTGSGAADRGEPAAGPQAGEPAVAAAIEAALKPDEGAARLERGKGHGAPTPLGRGAEGDKPGTEGDAAESRPMLPEADAPAEGGTDSPERRILRTFTSGAGTYTMYEDGRIEAILPEGRLDFASIDDLRRHLDQRALGGDLRGA